MGLCMGLMLCVQYVCEHASVHEGWSRCEGTHAWAVDGWVEGCVGWMWQVNLGHLVLSLGQLGPRSLRGLLLSAFFWAQSKVCILCLSLLPH